RGEDYTAAVPGPMHHIKRGIIFGKTRISGISKNGLHEVQIARQAAGGEKADLHALRGIDAGRRADQGTDQQRHKESGLVFLPRTEWECENIGGRPHGGIQERSKRLLWNRLLICWDRKTSVCDVKNSFRGSAITSRIVQHSLR